MGSAASAMGVAGTSGLMESTGAVGSPVSRRIGLGRVATIWPMISSVAAAVVLPARLDRGDCGGQTTRWLSLERAASVLGVQVNV